MKYFSIFYFRHLIYLTSFFIYLSFFTNVSAQINFSQSTLNFNGVTSIGGATSMEFGPDGRLYVSDYPGNSNAIGLIKILTIQRNGPTSYIVTDAEILDGVSTIPNHNDDGTTAAAINGKRQVTGLKVVGTLENPIIYVTSSDVRIGGGTGTGQKDVGLDTNSGVITRMTWTGSGWDVVDIVRGLPRSEENHSTNGLEFTTINGIDYLIVATGGFTNGGAPSSNFALITEYALAAAVLSVNLTELNQLPVQDDNGRSYIYDLPTLDDPTRPNANGFDDPDSPFYDGVDMNDPWGGNDGLNQAKLVPNGPVQIFSPGYRNSYDLVITESGALYVTDNGANGGWGGFPENEGTAAVNNNYNPLEPGSTSPSNGEQIDNKDHLELVTTDIENYISGSFYGGHPNPIRANPLGAGLYTDNNSLLGSTGTPIWRTQLYDPDGSTPGSTTNPNLGLPADWPPVPVSMANPVEGDWRGPSVPNPDGPDDNPIVIWNTNTNGITEYKASNFNNAMKGNLLATHSGGNLHRLQLNSDGTSQALTQNFLSGIGGFTLGLTSNGDNEVFPGTIWAGTINGIIAIFEPQDVIDCILPGDEGYDPLADYDFDGYSNQDEIDNGTDQCNGGSQPSDFDKVLGAPFISDLNDLDDDGDGIPDALDPMQLGNPLSGGSQAFILPIYNDLFINQQGLGGIFGLGLTGLMNNGDAGLNWLNWIDDRDQGPNPNDVLGGAAGLMTSHMTSGTALGSLNTQEKGYQYGVRSGMTTGQFTVTGAMIGFTGPLRLYGNTAAIGGELGFQIGDGTQSNYIKFVVTVDGFLALQEINDVPQAAIEFNLPEEMRPSNDIVFHFVVNPSDGQVILEYEIDGGARATLGSLAAQGSILNAIQQLDSDLIVGFIGTSGTDGVELEGTWDFLNVVPETTFALRINAGGPQILNSGVEFSADQNFVGGASYENTSAQVPDLYKTERSSPSQTFSYNIPLENGDYTINLHFAEIYWGATGGGAGGVGNRIFDVSVEGSLLLDNYDIYADVGSETVVIKSFPVTVSDGQLDIDFSALASVGGVDQPKLSALEVLGSTSQGVPILVNPIADQTSTIGEQLDGSLSVVASGGDGNLSYSALNLPPGLFIEPTNGQIGGAVLESASLNDPYIVTITVDDSDGISTDAVSIQFQWTILPESSLSWIDKDENENYTARHECSFVQAGDKFYLMGGRESSQTVDIYDYATDTWSSLSNSAPLEFNHFQATEYQGLIWVIGAFKTNDFPSELSAEHIWIFNPSSNQWIQGPLIPSDRQRGSAGLTVYNDKFYISGGNTLGHDGGYVSWFDEYDPATGIWTPLVDAPRARDHFHSAVIGDKLYLAGGRLSGGAGGTFTPVIPEVDVYDFSTSTWSTLSANLPTPRAGASAIQFNNKLLVIGGEVENEDVYGVITSDALKITEEYNPGLDTWSRIADLNHKRHGTQAIVSGNGVFTLAGSPNQGGGNQKNMEYLGTDAPVGEASVASIISVPSPIQFSGSVPQEIPVTISDGNTGVFITSIALEGPDMDKFNILSGDLSNALLKADSEHVIVVEYIGMDGGETANLLINHGVTGQEVIVLEASSFALRINSGGPQVSQSGVVFFVDQSFVGGEAYTNPSAQVPDLYKTERSSPSQTFSYEIPLENGDYTVILHFAEIYWGATGGGAAGIGDRIFDVSIEGNLVLDDYDINADVGPETVVTKSFPVTVSDGQLNIDFSALASVGGVDQPKVSAIEVFGNSSQGMPIIVNTVADQTSEIGQQLDGSLSVEASGGYGNLNYSALNLPPGLMIDPDNGQINGTVSETASVTTPYNVTITVDDSDGISTDAVTVSFLWTIIDNTSFALRINAGGPQILDSGMVFFADQNFVGGEAYTNPSAQVPDLYKTERSSPSQTFSYEIPLENGDYTVILHFAEIYWGATGGDGSGGVGNRIFDVNIEGSMVLDNYDINADVGPETVVAKTFMVSVSDGLLNIDFSSLPEVGGVDQPKVSAISIGVPITYSYDGIWTPGDPSGVATSMDNIVIISGNAIISSNTFSNSVIVNPGAGLTIDPAITLTTVNGMTLESFSDSYSSLILNGSIAGTINYERYVNMIGSGSTGGNDLVSPPLSGQRFDDFAEANSPLLAASGTVRAFAPFNNAANPGVYENYDIVTDAAEILQSGSGFRAATVGGASLTFSGTANTGNVNINITSEIGNFGKWNLIGNPYPSYVSIMDFLNHEEIPNIKNIDLLANASGIYGYDGAASDGWDVITLANAGNRLMAPGQGFFVAADNPASLQFTGAMRTTGTSDDFIPGRNAAPIYLKLKAATDTKSYTTDVYFNENASLGLDLGYDAQVWGGDTSNFILYSQLVEDNTGLAIALQALGSNDFGELSIPLGVNSNAGHQLRFSIEENSLPSTVQVYLEDTMANVVTLLNTTDYVVTPNSNLNGTGRFYLRLSDNTLALNTNDLNNIHIYTNYSEKSIVVNGRLEALTTFELYDIQGRLVRKTDLNASSISHTIDVSSIASGVYVVKLKNNSQFKTQKVILK